MKNSVDRPRLRKDGILLTFDGERTKGVARVHKHNSYEPTDFGQLGLVIGIWR